MKELLQLKIFYFIFYTFIVLSVLSANKIMAEQKIRVIADEIKVIDDGNIIEAEGNAEATSEDGTQIKSDKIIYKELNKELIAEGKIIINDLEGNTYYFDNLTSDDKVTNFDGIGLRARLDDGSRIVGTSLIKRENLSSIADAEYTPCLKEDYLIKNCPGWKLKSNKIYQNNDSKTIHYDHARIHLFNIPVFYLPYFSHPDPSVKKRSGFLMPTVETDQNLGDTFSIPIFYNIKSNLDLTFTPTIQSKSNNFYSINYRHLNEIGGFNIDTSLDDNNDNTGSSSHFYEANLNNPYGNLDTFLQMSNNDTYMRKNKINKLTVLKSGFNFERSDNDKYFSLDAIGYKHLAIQNSEQWEYLYPKITYNIDNIENNFFDSDTRSIINYILIKV